MLARGVRPVRSVLTGREWEVVDLMKTGASTAAIAAELAIEPSTVRRHRTNAMRKLGVRTREALLAAAVSPNDPIVA